MLDEEAFVLAVPDRAKMSHGEVRTHDSLYLVAAQSCYYRKGPGLHCMD